MVLVCIFFPPWSFGSLVNNKKKTSAYSQNLTPWIASTVKRKFTWKCWFPGFHWNLKHLSFLERFVRRLAMLPFTICSSFEIFVARVPVLKIKIFSVLKLQLIIFQSWNFLNWSFGFLVVNVMIGTFS